ncbi:MAG: AAA family ATPase [Bernardetiaceae bacterium]|nr:AAA family ATPase [Bernardetiaceae bacterium]
MNILIDKIRVKNFKALKDIEITLRPITILVGANNSGKTTLLRILNSVLGISRNQINQDDLFVDKDGYQPSKEIIVDIRIIPTDDYGNRIANFDNKWTSKLHEIQIENENEFFAIRTKYSFGIEDTPTVSYALFTNWDNEQLSTNEFKGLTQIRNNIKMYFIDAQRDILEDSKQRTSFFGKLVSQLDYGEGLDSLKQQISDLNAEAINNSPVLKHLKEELKKLNQAIQTQGEGVSLNPFPKKIRDLHKGMKVYFQDSQSDSFSMESHGMGTRSWASIITAGAFSSWQVQQIDNKIEKGEDTDLLFPILALEEPEAHLHPNAQRALYKQLQAFAGQKIISTHSPYIAGQAALEELRHFYKNSDTSMVSEILFDKYDREKIENLNQQLKLEGKTPDAYRKYNPQINDLKQIADTKLNEDDRRELVKEIFLHRGELLFTKALLLFEGITEEVALPHFYQKHFGRSPFEDGITLVSVGGNENYSPFLKFAKFLKIPVFILSDGDGDTETKVQSQIAKVYDTLAHIPLFILPNQADFEQFLFDSGYKEEINQAIDTVKSKESYLETYITELNNQKGKRGVPRAYDGYEGKTRALLDCMRENKTEFAEEIAKNIILSGKALPSTLLELFDKIAQELNLKPKEDAQGNTI